MTLRLLHLEKLGLPDIDDKETLILTPNNRIMRKFLASYEQLQLEHGKQAWNTPNVHPISTWIHNQALECQDMGCELISDSQILNPEQEMVLWQRIASNAKKIAMESNENYIGKVGHVAKTAQQAHSLMEMWDIDFNNSQFEHSPEAERFRQWAIEFESTCKIKGLITSSSLPKIIIQAIKHGYITPPKNIVLFAFDDIAPVYQDMFDAFSSTGSSITKTEPFFKNISTQRV
ncbi:MAG: hypothetical protein KZQ74_05270, partial [gamma proteobacterium symbiont of Bathyaustriella thionipta]|nr:hypothetical protein [gamma proteobacterium symbiont of Bathyaustriella thionipta]